MAEPLWIRSLSDNSSPRVRVFLSPHLRNAVERLSIGCGTASVEKIDTGSQIYVSNAFVPVPQWRPPTVQESAAIWADSDLELNRLVGLVSVLDPQDMEIVRESIEALRPSDPNLTQLRVQDDHLWEHPLTNFLLEKIKSAVRFSGPLACNGLAEHRPGLATVTFNHKRNYFIGVHLDAWDNLPIGALPYARNRISINLGREDRFFMFMNLTAGDMLTQLRKVRETDSLLDEKAIGKAFMAFFPNYPLIRLRLRPGEAYIAPTDNILHDATTLLNRQKSRLIAFRGYFDPCFRESRTMYTANVIPAALPACHAL